MTTRGTIIRLADLPEDKKRYVVGTNSSVIDWEHLKSMLPDVQDVAIALEHTGYIGKTQGSQVKAAAGREVPVIIPKGNNEYLSLYVKNITDVESKSDSAGKIMTLKRLQAVFLISYALPYFRTLSTSLATDPQTVHSKALKSLSSWAKLSGFGTEFDPANARRSAEVALWGMMVNTGTGLFFDYLSKNNNGGLTDVQVKMIFASYIAAAMRNAARTGGTDDKIKKQFIDNSQQGLTGVLSIWPMFNDDDMRQVIIDAEAILSRMTGVAAGQARTMLSRMYANFAGLMASAKAINGLAINNNN